jgi:uncharacterized protein YbjT (DUF2867 family)
MQKVLVAGATGYLGRFVVQEFKKQGYRVRALARNSAKLESLNDYIDETFIGEVTDSDSLQGICKDIDIVFTSIGITRQKDNMTYMDVDYQGNKNMLDLAIKSDVSKFIYVSAINAHLMKDLKMVRAKELFVDELKASELDYSIIRPTGFFSDMLEFLNMAKKGRVSLFGNGENKINPIHGADLAEVCVNAINTPDKEINVGGPVTYTYKEIAGLAFSAIHKKAKISTVPVWITRLILSLMRTLSSSKTYGPVEFMMTVLTVDVIAPSYGKEKLKDYYELMSRRSNN